MKSEKKMPRDRDREVKFLENSREILENREIQNLFNFWSKCFSFSKLLLYTVEKSQTNAINVTMHLLMQPV